MATKSKFKVWSGTAWVEYDFGGNVDLSNYLTTSAAASTYLGISSKAVSAYDADWAEEAGSVAWANVSGKPSSYYTLPTASSSTLGGVKIQSGDMKGTTNTNGIAAGLGHTHSNYLTSHQSLANYSTLANTIKSLSISGKTITYTKGDGSTGTLTTQDTTYSNASTSAAGLMSAADKGNLNTLVSLLYNDDSNTTVDTIKEVLKVFETYPEGTNLANALAGKLDKSGGIIDGSLTLQYSSGDDGVIITPSGQGHEQITIDDPFNQSIFYFPKDGGTIALTSDIPTNYVTTNTAQTVSGTKTYTGNNIFKNNNFEIKANSNTDDSWIKLTNASDSGYYAFGIRRPYASYGLQMKYHPASGNDEYYNIWHAGNFTPSNYLTTSAAASTYLGKTAKAASAGTADYATVTPWSGIQNRPSTFTPPTATSSTLGGVKVGSNITVVNDGTISLTKANVTSALGYTPVNPSDNLSVSSITASSVTADDLEVSGGSFIYTGYTLSSPGKDGTIALTSDLSNYLPKSGGTLTGMLTMPVNTKGLRLREHASYETGTYYGSAGNEALTFYTQNSVTGIQFVNGTIPSATNSWQSIKAGLQIKYNKVAINKVLGENTSPSYELDVDGSMGATTIYENGTALSEKYQAKGTYIAPTTGSEYYPKYIQTRLQNKTSWYGTSYPIYAWWETNSICKWVVDGYETKVDRAVKDADGNVITSSYLTSHLYRPIQVNGTQILANSSSSALNLKAGSNVTISNSSGTVTISATGGSGGSSGGMVKIFEGLELMSGVHFTGILNDGYKFYLLRIFDNDTSKFGYLFALLDCYSRGDVVFTGSLSDGEDGTIPIDFYLDDRGDIMSTIFDVDAVEISAVYRIG